MVISHCSHLGLCYKFSQHKVMFASTPERRAAV
jgi:hypothetical protein